MATKPEPVEHLWAVVFEYYPNFGFTNEAQEIFDGKVTHSWWVICQDGSIENRISRRRRATLIIDLEDRLTLDSMNLLPKFVKSGFSPIERDSWRVMVYDKDDPSWVDFVRIDAEGGLFLEGLERSWDHFNENLDELRRDIKRISASLER